MKTLALTLATLASLGAAASAQESRLLGASLAYEEPAWTYFEEDQVQDWYLAIDRDPMELPRSLSATAKDKDDRKSGFSLGPSGGYLRVKDADRGTWFGGVQARMRFGVFAAEASIQFHQNRYADGDVVVTQYPLQLTAFLYPFPLGPIRPYVLGGVGWYYSRIDYKDGLDLIEDDTDRSFGWHFGAGAELFLGDRVSVNADARYIFIDPDTDRVVDEDFNYWQITFGLNFFF